MSRLDNRPKATYPGDTHATVGQNVGPTLHGELLTVDQVTYDPATDTSTARFRYATAADIPTVNAAAFVCDRRRFAEDQIRAGAQ